MRIILLILLNLTIQFSYSQEILSPKYINLQLSNDLVDKTDYYYTSGLGLTVNHPILHKNPFNKLIPSLPHASDKVFGITISQDIFTPIKVDTLAYLPNDRPFVATLMLYMQKTSFQPKRKLRLYSGLGLGFIGNIALGEQAQNGFHNLIHNNVYQGWYNQLDNKLLLNYEFQLQKGLHLNKNNQFIGTIEAMAGNLRTNLGVGYLWRVGRLSPYFESYRYSKGKQKFYFSFFLDVKFKLIFFDATLIQSNNAINKPSYSLNNFLFHSRAGITVMYQKFGMMFVQNFLSPEFSTGFTHRYASLELSYRF
ncbi:lipid A deacylase LpxR family protein [uncultured Cytophaga sp.]|uniref:lipid A deacylase LpxR family protein n=1 Tax=uncultured Cytophaga sp. TaxID=160238 RepID=UPI002624E2F6|nr:lipid A deacylase LpxR family protein [uncultured Cytophaga sp.]